MVDIVIPIYKKNPDENDILSIKQVFKILGHYDITFIHPNHLDISNYTHFGNAFFKKFDDSFFENISGYNNLMLSAFFYESFSKKYILIYQTDAFVFKDDLSFWCDKDYDYIGAPWIRSQEKVPFLKKISDYFLFYLKKTINYKKNGSTQKNKTLLYNNVGNGGLSLRKRETFIDVINQLEHIVQIYLKPENQNYFFAEDVFFSIEPMRNHIEFKKPYFKEACAFSIENKVEKALKYNDMKLPFGCHRWNKENYPFWKKYIK